MQSAFRCNIFPRFAMFPVWLFALCLLWPVSVLANSGDNKPQQVITILRNQLTSPNTHSVVDPPLDWTRLTAFYKPRGFYPAWVDRLGPLPRAWVLREALLNANKEGLNAKNYYPEKIAALWDSRSPIQLAQLELLLSDAFFLYSVHLRTGQQPEDNFHWDIEPPEIDPVAELRYLLTVNDFQAAMEDLVPFHAGYVRLREALQRYRQIEQDGGWPVLSPGPVIRKGDWSKQVAVLRKRLIAEGDLELGPVKDARYFDDAVEFALERFQVRHGLRMDGVLGPVTRKVMNISISQRIKQIKYNMERWRWLPRWLSKKYIMVNTAGFNLDVIEDEDVQFSMNVIIGTPERPTPVVASQVHSVVFNPYWTVPPTIVFEDLLPRQRRNPGFFQANHIRVFRNGDEINPREVNWSKVNRDYFPYILRQDPGPKNSLGRIKFLFNNAYTVYLHDTPKKYLFDKEKRAFSSGCIRVEDPVRLASYLLGSDNGWTVEKITEAIVSGKYREVAIKNRIPIYLVYMTAWVEENGAVHFRPDIYQWDPKVSKCDVIR